MTKIDLINSALLHIGFQPIVSLKDKTPEGISASLVWDIAVSEFLGDFDWSFATEWAKLDRPVGGRIPFGFTYCHRLPTGFERLIAIKDMTSEDVFEITTIDDDRVLASNKTDVEIKYITKHFNLVNMSGTARMALMIKIAMHLDTTLNAGVNSKMLVPLSEEYKSLAKRQEMTGRNARQFHHGELTEVRHSN